MHSFIQIFTKHLLSAKYHTRHLGKYPEEVDRMPALESKEKTSKHKVGEKGQSHEAHRYGHCRRLQAGKEGFAEQVKGGVEEM